MSGLFTDSTEHLDPNVKYLMDCLRIFDFMYAVVILSVVIPASAFLYKKYWDELYLYWEKKRVPHLPGSYPQGSSDEYYKAKTFLGKILEKFYRKFAGQPYFGLYNGTQKLLVLRDPEIIKLILRDNFSNFRDRWATNLRKDDVLSHHLFLLNGDKWRSLRDRMSPTFSSGRLTAMFPLFVKCAEALDNLLLSLNDTEIDVKDIAERFSTDVICSCAFGLEMDCINNENNPFRIIESKPRIPKMSTLLKIFFQIKLYFPFIPINPKVRLTSKDIEDFMVQTIKETVEYREKSGHKRNDFIDLLIQLKEKGVLNDEPSDAEMDTNAEPVVMTLEVMAAQCYAFYAAGHEKSSTVKTLCLYELALHPEIQNRLYNEIETTISKHDGVTYQALNEMEYLEMVVSETLRKYPTHYTLSRICTTSYTLPSGLKIEKGQHIIIPLWALHHDPAYYPNPEEFKPERFLPNEKESRHPFVYLPFGEGPRICIGMRFGLLQTKMGIVTFLRKYKVETSEKTIVPLELIGDTNPTTRPKTPIILKITKRL